MIYIFNLVTYIKIGICKPLEKCLCVYRGFFAFD